MSTIYVFNQELSAVASVATNDVVLLHDTSASTKVTATVQQLNAGLGQVVSTTATALTITAASHAGRIIDIASASPIAITLPQATGTGNMYRFVVSVVATATAHTIKVANATDNFNGGIAIFDTSATDITAIAFAATATDDTISLNGTTKAGTVGTWVDIVDVATGLFGVRITGAATGSYATPFSASV